MERLYVGSKICTGLGLATNTYKKVLESGELTLRELITWAAGRGFSWVEIRDADVKMSEQELLDMKELADKLQSTACSRYGKREKRLYQRRNGSSGAHHQFLCEKGRRKKHLSVF